ncbi:hypothetical protein GGR54DRAFT_642886 [Hypoxylon sp. NC1633]|nr:hypothetical protein GGR54DRAFT_642886 [Hypoxylon sp. NC1633]
MCAQRAEVRSEAGAGGLKLSSISAKTSDRGHKLLLITPESDSHPNPNTNLDLDLKDEVIDAPPPHNNAPLVICFHGSGESCAPSWDALARSLAEPPLCLRVLMWDRGERERDFVPARAAAEMWREIRGEGLGGPCVLVAHSYGGAFARVFLELVDEARGMRDASRDRDVDGDGGGGEVEIEVVGMVLVETGQEGGLDAETEERQYRGRVLGTRPLSVVRGNSLLAKWRELESAEASVEAGDGPKKEELGRRREMMRFWDETDEKLKKRQLDLAAERGPKRYVHVPDCGHHVVRDRPDVVAREVAWVLENLGNRDGDGTGEEEERGGVEVSKMKKGNRIWGKIVAALFNRLDRLKDDRG